MYETTDALFKGICDSIREKDETTALIRHQDIPARIAAIAGGSGGEAIRIEEFYTYNGGGMKIEDGVASNFAVSSCVYLGKPFRPLDKQWEIQVKFKTPVSWTNAYPTLFASATYKGSPQCNFQQKDGKYCLSFSVPKNASEWGESLTSNYEFEMDKWYWVRFVFDKTKYIFLVSDDGVVFEEKGSVNCSGQFYQAEVNNSFMFGGCFTYGGNVFNGSIDLKDTYIKIGDELWWGKGAGT